MVIALKQSKPSLQKITEDINESLRLKNNPPSNQGPYRGFIARVMFRTNVACLSANKTNIAYIDSGGTHNFFNSRSYFETYDKTDITDVSVASSTSTLVGKGTITLPIN